VLYALVKAASAAFNPDNWRCTRSRSFFNCFTIPDKLANVVPPSGGDCNRGPDGRPSNPSFCRRHLELLWQLDHPEGKSRGAGRTLKLRPQLAELRPCLVASAAWRTYRGQRESQSALRA
jgi:hypothetical protein